MAEVLAGGPVAEGAEISACCGGGELVNIGEDLVDGIEMESAAMQSMSGIDGHEGIIAGGGREMLTWSILHPNAHGAAVGFLRARKNSNRPHFRKPRPRRGGCTSCTTTTAGFTRHFASHQPCKLD